MNNGIVFQVETDRVLQILAREIYDSPLALLRENVQNAYDAVRMRFAATGELQEGGKIDVTLAGHTVTITDNGIGMTEEVLRQNFWKAGSSGKHSKAAREAGVVGTFGIGAMANFGVCTELIVETRTEEETKLLRSVARRDSLKIAQECISFDKLDTHRGVGTTVTVELEPKFAISEAKAREYLKSYVALLPVPVFVNGTLISGEKIESLLQMKGRSVEDLGSRKVHDSLSEADCEVKVDSNGQVLVTLTNITLGKIPMDGEMALLQSGGQLMGLRSYFGLAPIPAIGLFQFGGFANLSFLQPTAGREALSRDSIEQVTRLTGLAELAASALLAKSELADRNTAFLQWLVRHQRWDMAENILIHALPDKTDVPLGSVVAYSKDRPAQYYTGTDPHIINTFASEGSCLFHVVQAQPRKTVQLQFLREKTSIKEVPDSVRVTRVYEAKDLTMPEASVLLRVASIIRDDYLIPNVEVALADMSHGVTVLAQQSGEHLNIKIARSSALLRPLLEFREKAFEVFGQFMKDFVRVHIYPRIQQFVPSSTKGGVDALRKTLERNRELYKYEEADRGDIEGVLGDFLSGDVTLTEVLQNVRYRGGGGGQTQSVSSDQVGSIEAVVPGVVESPIVPQPTEGGEFMPSPPILRDDIISDMKILTTDQEYAQLNGFRTLLGLSDRLMREESYFFREPHTTRVIWGGHRVIYIFTEATGQLSLYYDIQLRDPIEKAKAGGGFFPTTTLITGKRIFVPVPSELAEQFRVASGSREFYVNFDMLSTEGR